MSRFQAEQLLLGCTAEGAVLLAQSAPRKTPAVHLRASVRAEPRADRPLAALCRALHDLAPEPPAATPAGAAGLAVTLDDGLVRSFIVTPPRGAQGLRELRASAAARFSALYGESAEPWLLAADWQAAAPFIACALPRELHQQLEQLARTQGWHLKSVRPALVRVWNHVCAALPADGWLVVGFGNTLTLVYTRQGESAGVRTLRLSGTPSLAELATLLEQERLRNPEDSQTRARQSLLWAGGADWLPAAATIAGLASRTLPLSRQTVAAAEWPAAEQLALAGSAHR